MSFDSTTIWSIEAVQQLVQCAREGTPAEAISLRLKRPLPAVRAKLAELGLSVPIAA